MIRTAFVLSVALLAARPASAKDDIVQTALNAKQFNTLAAALQAADLVGALKGDGPFTVFAPTDAAFAKLPQGAIASLLKPENKEKLQVILAFHVVPGRVSSMDLLKNRTPKTLGGRPLSIAFADGRLSIGDAAFLKTDIACTNGVIHVIDTVLLPPAPKKLSPRDSIRQTLELAIDRGVPLFNKGEAGACADIYEIATRAVVNLSGKALRDNERSVLNEALGKLDSADGAEARAWVLRRAIDRVRQSLDEEGTPKTETAFQPIIEAPLPEGFPRPGPVGEVTLKKYPTYRLARTEGRTAFWTLFNHIKKNDIAMTAPVETKITERNGRLRESDMAFLYQNTDLGKTGSDGSVEVIDAGPQQVLSYGIRGPMSEKQLRAAKAAIEERLANETGWERAGDWRLLGYNSPMVPPSKRFWELQVPVTRTR